MAHKPEDQLMVRINVTLPLAIARKLRSHVPEKQRSKLIAGLLEKHFEEEKYDDNNEASTSKRPISKR